MSTTTITEPITVTRHLDGSITVDAFVEREAYPGRTYESEVFHGFCGTNGFVFASWIVGGRSGSTGPAQVDRGDAEKYLVGLATLVLAANGVTE